MTIYTPDFKDLFGSLITIGVLIYNNYRNRKKLENQQTDANARAETRHQEWMTKTDERLQEAEDRLDNHADRFDNLSKNFVPRQEMESKLNAIQQVVHSTDQWLRTMLPLLLGRVVPGGYIPPAEPEAKPEK